MEPQDLPGINRFTSEMGLASTRRWDEEGLARYLGSIGATASPHVFVGSRANTSRNVDYRDAAAHHYAGLSTQWRELLACLKESLFFPAFDSTRVERVRAKLLTEIGAIEEDQLELLKQEFYVRAYAGHPYGRPTVGTRESIAAVSPHDLALFHESVWTPDRCVVVIVGDVNAEEVAGWIASHWADLPSRRAGALAPSPPADWTFRAPAEIQTLERGKEYWTVNWGKPGAAFGEEEYWPSVVLSQVAGNDHFYKYVYGEGVSYRSWVRFWPNLGSGTWILENDVKRERFDEILGMFEEDLSRYASRGFTKKEFEDAVQRLVNSEILDAQTGAILAWNLAVAEGNGVGFPEETQAVERLRSVSFDDVQDLARVVFPPQGMLRLAQR
jgi:zinc protease